MSEAVPRWGLLIGVLFVGLLGGVAASQPTVAKAPPEPVCGVCTDALDEAADERGVALEREESRTDIRLHANGSAEFVARVTLATGTDRLTNASLREAIVRDVSYIVAEERTHLRTAIEGQTLVVRYRSPTVAHTTLGVVRFDAFRTRGAPPLASGGEGSPYPGTDRLMLHAPATYQVYGSHGAASNETTVVWYRADHERYAGGIKEDQTIAFVPADARLPRVRVRLAALIDWLA